MHFLHGIKIEYVLIGQLIHVQIKQIQFLFLDQMQHQIQRAFKIFNRYFKVFHNQRHYSKNAGQKTYGTHALKPRKKPNPLFSYGDQIDDFVRYDNDFLYRFSVQMPPDGFQFHRFFLNRLPVASFGNREASPHFSVYLHGDRNFI